MKIGNPATPADKLINRKGLIILNPLVITFLLLTARPAQSSIPTPYWYIILASFGVSVFAYLLNDIISIPALLYGMLLLDVPLIGTMIHFSGGIESIFSFLYIPLVIVASIFLYRNGSYILGLISVLFYILLILFEARNSNYSISYLMNRFYIMGLLFLFTAILSGAISERYRIRTEEVKRLKLTTEDIIKNLPTGLITIDIQGDILYTNIPDGETRSRVHLHLAKFLKYPDTPKIIELRIKQKSYLLSCAHIQNAQAALGILQDLTNIRRLEAKSRVSEQTKMLAELGGSLAHELRNPLSSIRGSLEVVARTEKNKKIIPFINMAVKESVRLNSIVTDFLNFAQFTPKKINKLLIGDILTEAILEAAQIFKPRPVSLAREGEDFYVAADPDRLKSGIVNILNNAFEVSRDHQKVTIRTYQEGREGILEIADQGRGIAKKDLKKIFHPFFTTKKGGTGLGLSIAQKVIEAHKGRIEVQSKIGKGTVFRIIFPPV